MAVLINDKEKDVKSYLFEVIMIPKRIISIRDRIEEVLRKIWREGER